MHRTIITVCFAILALFQSTVAPVRAEVAEITLAQQNGLAYLPMMVMESQGLIEAEVAARNLPAVKTNWIRLSGPSALVDAMLSGSLHFAANGAPSLALLWDRTKGGVKALGGMTIDNLFLNTRNPAINSIKDFTEKDRIAVPSIKISNQALYLQMAAEKAFGVGEQFRLDAFTIGLGHPDAMAAMLNPNSEITAHFTSSPFHEAELKAGARTILTSNEVLGGRATQLVFTTTEKFRAENPKLTEATVAALGKAMAWINADKPRAAKFFLDITKDKKTAEADILATLNSPDHDYDLTPARTGNTVAFMHRLGLIKTKPDSWKDLFFPEVHGLPGS